MKDPLKNSPPPKRDPRDPLEEQVHKLQIYIPTDLFNEMGRLFPHGMRRPVFQCLAEEILRMIEQTGNANAVCGAILTGELHLEYREQQKTGDPQEEHQGDVL